MDVVWLKRDVRLLDHRPLTEAIASGGPFLILYIYEPDQLAHETVHGSHVAFANEGLANFNERLQNAAELLGSAPASSRPSPLLVTTRRGEATKVLSSLHTRRCIRRLLSHQETGHEVSYARDKRVARWCKAQGVEWSEYPQSMVVRGISASDSSWFELWRAHLDSLLEAGPVADPLAERSASELGAVLERLLVFETEGLLTATQLGVRHAEDRPQRQPGGEKHALKLLVSFLEERAERYSGGISSPNSAWTACSRLSPYFAWGHVSIRTVICAVESRRQDAKGKWARSLSAFLTRFQWRGVYCQRFEIRCWMERRSVCEAWEHLRNGQTFLYGDERLLRGTSDAERLVAFEEGRTGYPMVDACMRCLAATGWLNFRMRCMVVSFAVYNFWLDWQAISAHLARSFLDFEPGIHFPQLQMQAGTTGVDMRCYNVTKQAKEQDPKGVFIRRYVPELEAVPDKFIHEPWKAKLAIGGAAERSLAYPRRVVDEVETAKAAKLAMSAFQRWWAADGRRRGEAPPPLSSLLGDQGPEGRPRKKARTAACDERNTDDDGGDPETDEPRRDAVVGGRGAHDIAAAFLRGRAPQPDAAVVAPTANEPQRDIDHGRSDDAAKGIGAVKNCLELSMRWACTQCTLWNTLAADTCDACGSPRPAPNLLPATFIEIESD
mmetsp:Transcript_83746/g.233577  ORF Transcript_83746/g.233577 Transcript_83746/m.233577 type:complete len:666 (-) Transcript_83746:88-2085(-)